MKYGSFSVFSCTQFQVTRLITQWIYDKIEINLHLLLVFNYII